VIIALGDLLLASSLEAGLSLSWRTFPPLDTPDQLEAALGGLRPSVAVIDLELGAESLLGRLPQLVARFPTTRFVVCTAHSDPVFRESALLAGATAFVGHDVDLRQISEGLRALVEGRTWPADPAVDSTEPSRLQPSGSLTLRERQVLVLRQEGRSHLEISRRLGISGKTVEDCCRSLRRKFGLPARVGVDWKALDSGSGSGQG
jgi:DNA-binding NarL/FixJ family response regulator